METLQNDACGGKFMIKSRMIAIAVALTMLFCSAFSVAAESGLCYAETPETKTKNG